jgi:hypothetical protein
MGPMVPPSSEKKNAPKAQVALGFLLLLLLLAGVGALVWYLVGTLKDASPAVAAALIAGMVTVFVSVTSLIVSRQFERRRAIEQEHRAKKIPVYEDFMQFWFRVLGADQMGQAPPTEEEIAQFLYTFTQKMIVWGSDTVLKQYASFRKWTVQVADQSADASPFTMLLFEQLLLGMRKDVGHKNAGIAQGDLLSLFINDIDEVLSQLQSSETSTPPPPM